MKQSVYERVPSFVSRRVSLLALCAALLLSAACARQDSQQQSQQPSPQSSPQTTQQLKTTGAAYTGEVEQWKAKRLESLKGEDGWLSLVGLHWLKDGENKIGSDPKSEVLLPVGKSPRDAGSLFLNDGKVKIEARPDSGITSEGKPVASLELNSDADGKPTVLKLGTLTFHVIKRGERMGVRVKDSASPERTNFRGLEYFPLDERWRVEARFEPYNPPKTIPIVNVLNMEENDPSPGALVFDIDGKTYRLDALTEEGEEQFFIIFADETSGKETYPSGRYLYAGPPDSQGRLLIDFNKAYSPPCAFTKYATCPLPPDQNHLPLRIEAGEKFAGHH